MKLRLRQIALAVADLDAATSQASQVLGLGPAYQDPAIVRYGLRNAVYAIGNTFLEFVSPITENTTVGRLLAKQGGDCGYMVILQTDAADEARARIDAAGVRVADQLDRNGAGFMHLHPKDVGGTLLSVDYMPRWSDWEWGGPDWQSCATHGEAITGVGINALDPQPWRDAGRKFSVARWNLLTGLRASVWTKASCGLSPWQAKAMKDSTLSTCTPPAPRSCVQTLPGMAA